MKSHRIFKKALILHSQGQIKLARELYIKDLESNKNYDSYFNIALIDMQRAEFSSAVSYFSSALTLRPNDFECNANLGICFQQMREWRQAEIFFTAAYNLKSDNIKVINHLSATLSMQGKVDEAFSILEQALILFPTNFELLFNAGTVLKNAGLHIKAITFFEKLVKVYSKNKIALAHLANAYIEVGRYEDSLINSNLSINLDPNYSLAYLAKAVALHKLYDYDRALENYKKTLLLDPNSLLAQINVASITISRIKYENDFSNALQEAKKSHKMTIATGDLNFSKWADVPFFRMKHDIQQAQFLQAQGYSSDNLSKFLDVMPGILSQFNCDQGQKLISLTNNALNVFRDYLNESFVYQMPIINTILNMELDWHSIQENYLSSDPEIIFIDNFLNYEALKAFHYFSNYSKVWYKEYKGCYLGAFANQGFVSPLHLKLALELKNAMPRVFKDYPISQIWGFKYDAQLGSGINVHADFAKVNLNFWITPSDSNLDINSGGLRVYTVPAPSTWTFHDYNRNSDQIYEYLSHTKSSSITIPYKGNRAVLFNSALFHETDVIKFKEGYENRRVNMTYLFGSQLA